MKLTHLGSVALVLSSIFAAGCASDPAKKADDAHDQQLVDQRKSEQKQADNVADARIDNAEKERKASTTSGTLPADAKLTEARHVASAKATERAQKADARIKELKGKLAKAGGKAPASIADSLRTVDTQRTMVQTHIDALPNASNDGFEAATKNVDSDLDTLDTLIDKAAKQVSDLK